MEDTVKTDLGEVECVRIWIASQQAQIEIFCENNEEHPDSIKSGNLLTSRESNNFLRQVLSTTFTRAYILLLNPRQV